MINSRLHIQSMEKIDLRIKKSSIFLVNQSYELDLELSLIISLEIARQFGQEFNVKNHQLKMTAL